MIAEGCFGLVESLSDPLEIGVGARRVHHHLQSLENLKVGVIPVFWGAILKQVEHLVGALKTSILTSVIPMALRVRLMPY